MHEPKDVRERVATLEVVVDQLEEFRRDTMKELKHVQWMLAVAVGSGLLGLVKGCGHG